MFHHSPARALCLFPSGFAKDLAIGKQMDQMSQDEIVSEFQRRRQETWRIIRPWVVVAVTVLIAIAGLFATDSLFDELWKLIVLYGGFMVLLVAVARSALVVSKLYRSPACDASPRNRGQVLLDPDACPAYGVRLR